jgi:hypothetical protein
MLQTGAGVQNMASRARARMRAESHSGRKRMQLPARHVARCSAAALCDFATKRASFDAK